MAIAFDVAASDAAGALSWSHTCTGTNLILVVGVQFRDTTPASVTGITYNSVPLTKIDAVTNATTLDTTAELWYLVAPAAGAHTIAVTTNPVTPLRASAGSMSFTGVDQTAAAIDAHLTLTGTTATPSMSITSVANNCVPVISLGSRNATAITPGTGTTEEYDVTAGTSQRGWGAFRAAVTPAGSSTFAPTLGGAADWSACLATLKPAATGVANTSSLTGTLSFTGGFLKTTNHRMTGGLSFTGSFLKAVRKNLTAGLSFIGSLPRRLTRAVTGALSFSGNLSKAHLFTKVLTAVLSFNGAFTTGSVLKRTLTAALSFTGVTKRRTAKSNTGGLSFVGALARGSVFFRTLTAALSFSGLLGRRRGISFTAGLSFSGLVSTFRTRGNASIKGTLSAVISSLTNLVTRSGGENVTTDSSRTNIATAESHATIEDISGQTNTNTLNNPTNTTET